MEYNDYYRRFRNKAFCLIRLYFINTIVSNRNEKTNCDNLYFLRRRMIPS